MEEWLIPELKERDIVKDAIVTRTMKVPAGEFVHIVTKEDIKQASADIRKATTKKTQQSGRADKVSQKGKKNKKKKTGKELQQ